MKLNLFDKICAVVAFLLAILFLLLGGFGLFLGCNAHFSLPPLLGIIPAFVGWGIVKSVLVAWKKPAVPTQAPLMADDPIQENS